VLPRTMDEFGTEEMAIPEIKLIQSVGGDTAKEVGAEPGDFFNTLTDEVLKEGLDFVLVDIQKVRTFWGRTDISDEPPECASMDGKTSIDGKECDQCEHKLDTPWLVDAQKRREMCTLSYNIIAINPADFSPFLIRASGISTQSVRELLTQLKLNRTLKGEYHRAIIRLTSVKKKTRAGEAFAMHFRLKEIITDQENAKDLLEESTSLLGTQVSLPEQPEELGPAKAEVSEPKPAPASAPAPAPAPAPEPEPEPEPEPKPTKEKPEPAKLDVDF